MIEIGGMDVPERAIVWKFVRASGPGGQHVNKVATAVECRFLLAAAGIRGPFRSRLEKLAGNRLNAKGEVVLVADSQRSQARNRAAALARLGALIAAARPAPAPRIPTNPTLASKAKRREDKRRRAQTKDRRRPPPAEEEMTR